MVSRRRRVCLGLLPLGALGLVWASGVAFWLALGVVAVALVGLLQLRGAERFVRIAMVVGSVFAGLALLETALWLWERAASEPLPVFVATDDNVPLPPALPPEIRAKIARMQGALVMPHAWRKRDLATIEGIDAYWAYPAQLERALSPDFRVEILNLGVRGYASEEILDVLRRFVPELEPDLVVYGVCLNDCLERGGRQRAAPALLPEKLTKILTRRTRLGLLVDERSDTVKRALGLQPDFYTDLLDDFDARYRRFGEDVAAMNALVTGSGLPAMIAMVLDQGPRLGSAGRKLALAAERQLRAAGIETVDSESFYRRYDGTNFGVSRWESHPNEKAHAIWASELADRIRQRTDLARFAGSANLAREQED